MHNYAAKHLNKFGILNIMIFLHMKAEFTPERKKWPPFNCIELNFSIHLAYCINIIYNNA